MTQLCKMTALELNALLLRGDVSSREIMLSVLESIDAQDDDIGAFLLVRERGDLLREADAIDARRARGDEVGALGGLPVAIKDCICTEGLATTCASRILGDFTSPYDATVVERIRNADGIVLGKTNMDEFAMGSSTENSSFKTTRNPRNPAHVPGGSSGGSAACVAAGECPLALGTDTGGSIRQPAAFCGVVGLKPTYGRVSRYGLVAFGSSLDQIGCLTGDVADAAFLLKVIAGHDRRDATSIDEPVPDYVQAMANAGPWRIGVPEGCLGEGLDTDVRKAVERTLDILRSDGHDVAPVRLPHTEYAIPTYYVIACAEASANLARYDGVRYGYRAQDCRDIRELFTKTRSEGFGDEVKRRIMLGTYALSAGYYDAYYGKAQRVRTLIQQDFQAAFELCDIVANPVTPTPAFKLGEKVDDPLAMYLGDVYTVTANLAGLPAISVPCGATDDGLPVGIQLAAPPLGEPALLAAAGRIEQLHKAERSAG